jgi:DNA polymerase III subunit beta
MKIKCSKENIKKGFHTVENIVTSSSIKPILQNIKIVAKDNILELSTTDLEVSISYVVDSVEVIEPGVIVCPEVKMSSIVKEWTEDYIEITEENRVCLITGKDSYFKVLCTDPEEFPAIPLFVDENYIEVDKAALTDMIRKTAFTLTGEKVKYGSNGIFLDINSNHAKMVANDGRRLAEIKKKVDNPGGLKGCCIIPIKGILQVLRILSNPHSLLPQGSSGGVAKIRIEERRIFVNTKNTTLCSQLIEGQYPEYGEVIPSNLDKRVILDKNTFFSAVRRGSVMTTEDYKLLKFKISNNLLELECISPDVGEAKIDVSIEYTGDELEVGLNPDYILDFLKVVDTDKVVLELKDGSTAAVFKVGNNCTYVVMPMSLEGD